LRRRGRIAKRGAEPGPGSFPMSGIYMILLFVVVMAALNRFEFGRFD
jgi:ribose/xylose/arabinose/galactoside ABC-type transport system permease subunit